ncbi:MAG: hypothetical protein ACK5CV_11195 [Bacteroidota bacterium]
MEKKDFVVYSTVSLQDGLHIGCAGPRPRALREGLQRLNFSSGKNFERKTPPGRAGARPKHHAFIWVHLMAAPYISGMLCIMPEKISTSQHLKNDASLHAQLQRTTLFI